MTPEAEAAWSRRPGFSIPAERGGRFGGKGTNQARPHGQQIPSPCQWHPDIPMAQRPMATAYTDGETRLRNQIMQKASHRQKNLWLAFS